MSRNEHSRLSGKVQHLAELIVQARPDKMSFESEEQFLAMLSLGSLPVGPTAKNAPAAAQ